MTERKKRFCHEYLVCEDVHEAARRVGYKSGAKLLEDPEVQDYLSEIAVADLHEVRAFLTRTLRESASTSERIKAADMLLKCGISQKTEPVVIFGEEGLE